MQKKRFPNLYKEELTAEKAKNSYKFDIENDGEWNQFNILKGNIKRKILIKTPLRSKDSQNHILIVDPTDEKMLRSIKLLMELKIENSTAIEKLLNNTDKSDP